MNTGSMPWSRDRTSSSKNFAASLQAVLRDVNVAVVRWADRWLK
jgi:hypothetical protein